MGRARRIPLPGPLGAAALAVVTVVAAIAIIMGLGATAEATAPSTRSPLAAPEQSGSDATRHRPLTATSSQAVSGSTTSSRRHDRRPGRRPFPPRDLRRPHRPRSVRPPRAPTPTSSSSSTPISTAQTRDREFGGTDPAAGGSDRRPGDAAGRGAVRDRSRHRADRARGPADRDCGGGAGRARQPTAGNAPARHRHRSDHRAIRAGGPTRRDSATTARPGRVDDRSRFRRGPGLVVTDRRILVGRADGVHGRTGRHHGRLR